MSSEIEFTSKKQGVEGLQAIFTKWENFLSRLTEQQALMLSVHKDRTVKDDLAHVWEWQRVSIARLEAALSNKTPMYNWWINEYDLWEENNTEKINESIYTMNKDRIWLDIYKDWKKGFSRFIDLSQQINEPDLLSTSKFSWLRGYSLIAVLSGSYNHHNEHLEKLTSTLKL